MARLTAGDIAILETFVVPRYLHHYGDLALELLSESAPASVVHLGCRTGYLDRQLVQRLDDCALTGLDGSLPAIELARNKAGTGVGTNSEYLIAKDYPTQLEGGCFSHVVSLHPMAGESDRLALFGEAHRLLCPGGQALIALPLRGSFQELADLCREFALKSEDKNLSGAIDHAMQARPNLEMVSDELESAGFDDVDVEIRRVSLNFDTGREFVDDPMTRLMILPDFRSMLQMEAIDDAVAYVREAIDKYWASSDFELSVNVGCASARKF